MPFYLFHVTRGKTVQTFVNDLQNECHNPFTFFFKKKRTSPKRKSEVIICSLTIVIHFLAQMLAELSQKLSFSSYNNGRSARK